MLVARMRRLAPLLFFIPVIQVSARDHLLFTSSVTYCSEPDALLIQQFDVVYFQKNTSVWFNISAASVEPNVSVSANIMLNVYGMHPFNFTLDLCSLFNGALCPLPTYNFTGSDSISLPSSLGVSDRIPGIAFQIPDLEAYAQLTLTDVNTGEPRACVQATLSNGWSTHQVAVEWTTGAMALLALLSAIWYSQSPNALAPHRLFDLLYLFQWAASTALLDLNYSSVYIAFTTNFSWALGLFPASATSPIQLSINNMRHLTGGSMSDATSGSAVALVNRKLSPYNAAVVPSGYHATSLATETLVALRSLTAPSLASRTLARSVQEPDSAGTVQLVTATSSNVLQAGVPIYVEYVGIATANAFMTVFLVAMMLSAILVVTLVVGYAVTTLASRRTNHISSWCRRELYPGFACAWLLRVCLVALTPTCIFALYQWTLKDSWLSILLSVLLLLGVLGYLCFCIFRVVRLAVSATPYALYAQPKVIATYGPLFALYRPERYFASILFLVSILVKAIFIAFARADGEVQVISILVVECAVFAYLLFLRPHKTRGGDVLATYLALTRVVCTGLMIAFIQSLNVAAIPRVAIGIIIAVIISLAVIVMFVNTLVNLGLMKVPTRFRRRQTPPYEESTLEKGDTKGDTLGRPRNPTPQRNIPLDPNVHQTYPESPSEIATEEHSVYSEESGSTTLGSLLPRRWSLQPSSGSHSRAPSQSQYSSTNASSPRYSHPPSPPHSQSASHSRHPTIDEHEPIAY